MTILLTPETLRLLHYFLRRSLLIVEDSQTGCGRMDVPEFRPSLMCEPWLWESDRLDDRLGWVTKSPAAEEREIHPDRGPVGDELRRLQGCEEGEEVLLRELSGDEVPPGFPVAGVLDRERRRIHLQRKQVWKCALHKRTCALHKRTVCDIRA